MRSLLSQGAAKPGTDQGTPFVHNGVQYGPSGLKKRHWSVDRQGLEVLAANGRLWSNVKLGVKKATADSLRLKIYQDEMPGRRLNNLWHQQIKPTSQDKGYPVQTGDLAIERCLLMTTRPGDLVLDPTCGGGTTPVVAERWGRRWIAIDSSRESIAVTRERVLLKSHPTHLLIGTDLGFATENQLRREAGQPVLTERPSGGAHDPATGLVVKRMPHVTAASLAYRERPDKQGKQGQFIWLVDQPEGKKHTGRVSGCFTVETELLTAYETPEDVLCSARQVRRDRSWRERVEHELNQTGVRGASGTQWDVVGLDVIAADDASDLGEITHQGKLVDRKTGQRQDAVFALWPEDARVDAASLQRNVNKVISRFSQAVLVAVGTEFTPGSQSAADGERYAVSVVRVSVAQDLHLRTAAKKDSGRMLLVAEPAVVLEDAGQDRLQCVLKGWNEYNPITRTASFQGRDQVRMWLLDTDYDGTQFFARRIHLAGTIRDKERESALQRIFGKAASAEAKKVVFSYTSMPFKKPENGRIALRVITLDGSVLSWSGAAA